MFSGCSVCGAKGHNKRTCEDMALRREGGGTISVQLNWKPAEKDRARYYGAPPTPASVVLGAFKRGRDWP